MDEGLLNDLLECSVCLERLDTSSRVLPCQHTFCLKCLKVIVESHKELRCPECRVLVEAKVEELPPNVLLMRILEGMRNSGAPRKVAPRTRSGHQTTQAGQQSRSDAKLPPHGRAIYDFISKEPGDLSFKKNETILFHKRLDTFWYQGECSGRSGVFPITYVQVVVPLPVPTALCKALYDFRMSAPDEEGCLAFDKGAIITVHRRVDENWAEGRLEQRVGIFPIAFVELNQAARHLMTSPPLNRPVPPIPEHVRVGHLENRHQHHTAQNSHRYQQMSLSTPTTQQNYQNVATMSQSHSNYHNLVQNNTNITVPQAQLVPQSITVGGLVTAVPRNIMEPQTKHSLDLIHFTNNKAGTTMALQRINDYDRRGVKFDNYNTTPVHKVETTYQNVRAEVPVSIANFTNSSDSSSSVNTPIVSSASPNTSSDTSTSESAEPSVPSSPDNVNNTNNVNKNGPVEEVQSEVNSIAVLSLNESSTATNTSLNVSLPAESTLNASASSQNENLNAEQRLEVPSSSKPQRSSGPESLLNFGLGLQAALSPAHNHKEGNYGRRDSHHREKRHSLTPSTHLQGNHATQNRHSAEILATSLLDHSAPAPAERARAGSGAGERRRRRSRSSERPLPAHYIALYPYKPQKPDELELKKGGIYMVTERCRDGWYKGCSERQQRCGVFPGNYVTSAHTHRDKYDKSVPVPTPVVKPSPSPAPAPGLPPPPPDAPPREGSPIHTGQPLSCPWSSSPTQAQPQQTTPRLDKSKEKKPEKSSSSGAGVSLMKRLAAMKKCKSPPPAYSMDNPVFDDGPGSVAPGPSVAQHSHVRSGSCPSQLLRSLPGSERIRVKERPALFADHQRQLRANNENPWQTQHRKSQSLDVTTTRRGDRHHSQPVKERFRCIVAYPPNSEYELELKVDDIVIVSKKRGDGWYKGTLQRTGRTGLFPASFVQSCPQE